MRVIAQYIFTLRAFLCDPLLKPQPLSTAQLTSLLGQGSPAIPRSELIRKGNCPHCLFTQWKAHFKEMQLRGSSSIP